MCKQRDRKLEEIFFARTELGKHEDEPGLEGLCLVLENAKRSVISRLILSIG
jgi:hypothetical protein